MLIIVVPVCDYSHMSCLLSLLVSWFIVFEKNETLRFLFSSIYSLFIVCKLVNYAKITLYS